MKKIFLIMIGIVFLIGFISADTGCCFDVDTGLCSSNAEQTACENLGGEFTSADNCNSVSRCIKGCCILGGDNVEYITSRACQIMSISGGIQFNWQAGVSEESCLAISGAQEMGACTYGGEYEKNCDFTTRSDCNGEFHSGLLCTAQELNTLCEASDDTTCVEGKDQVYFLDSCGNRANIYDANKRYDQSYWTHIRTPEQSCNYGNSNAGSKICGNCDYTQSSTCKSTSSNNVDYGNHICKDLNCGNRKNGESWCQSEDADDVGSRHFRKYCLNGEIHTEPCGDYRTEYCSRGVCFHNPYSQCIAAGNDTEDCGEISGCTMWGEGDNIISALGLQTCISDIQGGMTFWDYAPSEDTVCTIGDYSARLRFIRSSNGYWYFVGTDNLGNNYDGAGVFSLSQDGWTMSGSRLLCRSANTASINHYFPNFLSDDTGCNYAGVTRDIYYSTPSSYWGSMYIDPNFVELLTGRCRALGDCDGRINYVGEKPAKLVKEPKTNFIGLEGREYSTEQTRIVYYIGNYSGRETIRVDSLRNGTGIVAKKYSEISPDSASNEVIYEIPCYFHHKSDSGRHVIDCYLKYECQTYRAPSGSSACEICGEDGVPCSEYRCKSLGQKCEYNEPSGADRGYCKASSDVSPPKITPLRNFVSENYSYASITQSGFSINPDILPNTAIQFGVKTDEEALCKFDIGVSGNSFEEMENELGENWGREHKVVLSLPGQTAANIANASEHNIITEGNFKVYVRCMDGAENWNIDPFLITFNVMDTPDTIAPIISNLNPVSGFRIKHNTTQQVVSFKINEPAECRWDLRDVEYDLMLNDLNCDTTLTDYGALNGYGCYGSLTNVTNDTKEFTEYYIRCKDQPWLEGLETDIYKRNTNFESKKYILKASEELLITELTPRGDVIKNALETSITLRAVTFGGGFSGKAMCVWKINNGAPRIFFNTNSSIHSQVLTNRSEGEYNLTVACVDQSGNRVTNTTSFSLTIDRLSPSVSRAYYSSGSLKVITDENSECKYTDDSRVACSFDFRNINISSMSGTGKQHTIAWEDDKTYYIKCGDYYDNINPGCGIIVRTY